MTTHSSSFARLIFTGTGTSEGIPLVTCITDKSKSCSVCRDAAKPGSKNRRRNTGIVLQYNVGGDKNRNIVIDCGKFFYHSALEWFVTHEVDDIDAVILTHDHADCIFGLDDLRDWTRRRGLQQRPPLKVYCSTSTYNTIATRFPYLAPASGVKLIEENVKSSFHVECIDFKPLPVEHGENYTALGFLFGRVAYMSDVHLIYPDTLQLLKAAGPLELLIVDGLRPTSWPTHFSIPEAIDLARTLKPKKTFLTGMNHFVDHETWNSKLHSLLSSEGLDIELAYDGLAVPITSLNISSTSSASLSSLSSPSSSSTSSSSSSISSVASSCLLSSSSSCSSCSTSSISSSSVSSSASSVASSFSSSSSSACLIAAATTEEHEQKECEKDGGLAKSSRKRART